MRERLKRWDSSSDESRRKESCEDEARWVKCRSTMPVCNGCQRVPDESESDGAHQRRSDSGRWRRKREEDAREPSARSLRVRRCESEPAMDRVSIQS